MSDPRDLSPEEARAWIKEHFVRKVCDDCEGECTCEPAKYALVSPRPYVKPIRDEFAIMVADGYFELVPKYCPTDKLIEEIDAATPSPVE